VSNLDMEMVGLKPFSSMCRVTGCKNRTKNKTCVCNLCSDKVTGVHHSTKRGWAIFCEKSNPKNWWEVCIL
jgi:hypothetical protein